MITLFVDKQASCFNHEDSSSTVFCPSPFIFCVEGWRRPNTTEGRCHSSTQKMRGEGRKQCRTFALGTPRVTQDGVTISSTKTCVFYLNNYINQNIISFFKNMIYIYHYYQRNLIFMKSDIYSSRCAQIGILAITIKIWIKHSTVSLVYSSATISYY